MKTRILAFLAAAVLTVGLNACGDGGKTYDIAPVFPLTADKCAKYNGQEEGSGLTATCLVTKDDCERAAADWREAMEGSGVNDAIEFTCE
ncbi:MAG TPA: hypothetical protein VFX35_12110 [Solirubrobacterales bacterium]|nr:hypothetical protein [Solirubrobacterales bacterium]